ncbi:MAG: hypothetical protein ABI967_13680 [bacterium]
MKRAQHNGNGDDPLHVTETPDVSHIKNLDVTHEGSDVDVPGVLKFVGALTVMGIVVFVLMWAMFRFLYAQEDTKEPDPGPMAMKPEERLPPEPRLQAAPGFGVKLKNGEWVALENKEPAAEYHVLREQWEHQLKCSEPETPSAVECLPIDQAMEKVIGQPSRVGQISAEGAGPRVQDYGIDPPTAASSGRMTEKGRQ